MASNVNTKGGENLVGRTLEALGELGRELGRGFIYGSKVAEEISKNEKAEKMSQNENAEQVGGLLSALTNASGDGTGTGNITLKDLDKPPLQWQNQGMDVA